MISQDAYEVVSLLLRYALVTLAAIILFLVARGTVASFFSVARARKKPGTLPGNVKLVVEYGGGDLVPAGSEFIIEKEALIGSSRRCDIRLKHPSVAREHAQAVFTGQELLIRPVARAEVTVSGAEIGPRAIAHHDDSLRVGDISLRVVFLNNTP